MTIYDYTNSALGLRAASRTYLRQVQNGVILPSALSNGVQTITRPGEHWQLQMDWDNLTRAQLRALVGFFARVNGPEHRVRLRLDGYDANLGNYGGTPLVAGGSQTGATLACDGASASITDWAKAGDIIGFENQICMVTADVDSDGGGNVNIPIWPHIRSSPADNHAIDVNVAGAKGVFIMTTPVVEMLLDANQQTPDGENLVSLSLEFAEDVTQ